jgi:hypothetical protein
VIRDNSVRARSAPPPLRTNLDLDLQRYAHEYFGDSLRGAVVALEPKTGGVLALYSAPSYDINRFIGGVPPKYYASLQADPHHPLTNRALQGLYAPASTWKLATAVIGLELGLVTMDTRMPTPCTVLLHAASSSVGTEWAWGCDAGTGHRQIVRRVLLPARAQDSAVATACRRRQVGVRRTHGHRPSQREPVDMAGERQLLQQEVRSARLEPIGGTESIHRPSQQLADAAQHGALLHGARH